MSNDYPDIKKGTRWQDTHARQWQNLADDVRGPASIQAGPGILVTRVGQHFNVRVSPPILQLLTRRLPAPSVEGGSATARFQVVNRGDLAPTHSNPMQGDYFLGVKVGTVVDPETDVYAESDLIKIAKPHTLRRTPWHGRTVYHAAMRTYIRYVYDDHRGVKRDAERSDEPLVIEQQFVSPEWLTEKPPLPHPDRATVTTEDVVTAELIGEERTGVMDVKWQDTNESARRWSVLPEAFRG